MRQKLFWPLFLNRIIFFFFFFFFFFFEILFQKCKCIHVLLLWAKFYLNIHLGKWFFNFWSRDCFRDTSFLKRNIFWFFCLFVLYLFWFCLFVLFFGLFLCLFGCFFFFFFLVFFFVCFCFVLYLIYGCLRCIQICCKFRTKIHTGKHLNMVAPKKLSIKTCSILVWSIL